MNSGCNPDMQEPLFYTPSQTKKPKPSCLHIFPFAKKYPQGKLFRVEKGHGWPGRGKKKFPAPPGITD
jgi:hypothetical protein